MGLPHRNTPRNGSLYLESAAHRLLRMEAAGAVEYLLLHLSLVLRQNWLLYADK